MPDAAAVEADAAAERAARSRSTNRRTPASTGLSRATTRALPKPVRSGIRPIRARSDELAGAMFDAVRTLEDSEASEMAEDEVRSDTLERVPHFLDEEWTWRR